MTKMSNTGFFLKYKEYTKCKTKKANDNKNNEIEKNKAQVRDNSDKINTTNVASLMDISPAASGLFFFTGCFLSYW